MASSKKLFNELVVRNPVVGRTAALLDSWEETDPAHDRKHVMRVVYNAVAIAQEEGADLLPTVLAALLHDYRNLPKDHPDSKMSAQLSADFANEQLTAWELPPETVTTVCDAILNHSFSRGQIPKTLEGKVVQDADRLEALGAIGLFRCLVTGAKWGLPLYSEKDPLCRRGREPNDREYSLDHFHCKLYKLPAMMQTASGRSLAEKRVALLRSFMDELGEELGE